VKETEPYAGIHEPIDTVLATISHLKSNPAYDLILLNIQLADVKVKVQKLLVFYTEDKEVLLLTHDNKHYIIPYSVEELSAKLDPKLYFRVNRHYIISAEAISKVHNYFNFKLKVELSADPKLEIIVSRTKTTAFKLWMNGETV